MAINEHGLYVIDPANVLILLGLKHEELSWDYAKPSQVGMTSGLLKPDNRFFKTGKPVF